MRQDHVRRQEGSRPQEECQRRFCRVDSPSDSSAVERVREPPSPNSEINVIISDDFSHPIVLADKIFADPRSPTLAVIPRINAVCVGEIT